MKVSKSIESVSSEAKSLIEQKLEYEGYSKESIEGSTARFLNDGRIRVSIEDTKFNVVLALNGDGKVVISQFHVA